jgi:hypothetical protein
VVDRPSVVMNERLVSDGASSSLSNRFWFQSEVDSGLAIFRVAAAYQR